MKRLMSYLIYLPSENSELGIRSPDPIVEFRCNLIDGGFLGAHKTLLSHSGYRRMAHVVSLNIGHLGVDVLHSRGDVGMPQEFLEVDYRAARRNELRGHGVAAAVEADDGAGRNTAGDRHALDHMQGVALQERCTIFGGKYQIMLIGPGSQVVEEYARCLLRHRYDAFFTSLAHDPRRALLQVQVLQTKVYPLAGTQTAVQHQYTGRMDACLVWSAWFEVEELFDVFRRKDAANPLLSFLLRQLDTTLNVFQFQQPVHEGL